MRTLNTPMLGRKASARYGPLLLCVRYRYKEGTRELLKNVEPVGQWPVEREPDWQARGAITRTVALRLSWRELHLRKPGA